MDDGETGKEMIVKRRDQKTLKNIRRKGHALNIDVCGYDSLVRFCPPLMGNVFVAAREK